MRKAVRNSQIGTNMRIILTTLTLAGLSVTAVLAADAKAKLSATSRARPVTVRMERRTGHSQNDEGRYEGFEVG
jgi:hypothetical protein